MPFEFVGFEEDEEPADPKGGQFVSAGVEEDDYEPGYTVAGFDITDPVREIGGPLVGLAKGLEWPAAALGRKLGRQPQTDFFGQDRYTQEEYENLYQQLKEAGMEPGEIVDQIGYAPLERQNIVEQLDEAFGGRTAPKTSGQRARRAAMEEGAEFVGLGAVFGPIGQIVGEAGVLGPTVSKVLASSKHATIAGEFQMGGLFGLGSATAKEYGGGPESEFVAGLLTAGLPGFIRTSGSLINKGVELGRGLLGETSKLPQVPKFLEEAGTKAALADVELHNKALENRIHQTSQEAVNEFASRLENSPVVKLEDLPAFNAREIEQKVIQTARNNLLDRISPRGTIAESLGAIQDVINENFKAVKETYKGFYKIATEGGKLIPANTDATVAAARSALHVLDETLATVSPESSIRKPIKELFDTLKEYVRSEAAYKTLLKKPNKTKADLINLNRLSREKTVRVSQLMGAKRSLNAIKEHQDFVPSMKNFLNPITEALNYDIRSSLKSEKALLRAYDEAEKLFKDAQETFHNQNILKFRKARIPEEQIGSLTNPSFNRMLNTALGESKEVKNLAKRLTAERIAEKPTAEAYKSLKENESYLGKRQSNTTKRLVEAGDTLTGKGGLAIRQQQLLEDVAKSVTTGVVSSSLREAMQSPVGYSEIKRLLAKSPSGKQVFKAIERNVVEDLFAKALNTDRTIDFKKARFITENPQNRRMIQSTLGKDGLRFFERMESYGKNMAENLRLFEAKEPELAQMMADEVLKLSGKSALFQMVGAFATGGKSLAIIPAAHAVKQISKRRLIRTITDPKSQKALQELGQKGLSPQKTRNALFRMDRP